jgi:hypothetical protein
VARRGKNLIVDIIDVDESGQEDKELEDFDGKSLFDRCISICSHMYRS